MIVKCGICGSDIEVPSSIEDGQHILCPVCGGKSSYSRPQRIKLPTDLIGRPRRARDEKAPDPKADEGSTGAKKPLKVIRKDDAVPVNVTDGRKIHMAEEHAEFYQRLKNSEAKQKTIHLVASIIGALVLVVVGLSAFFVVEYRKNESHRLALEREREADRIRIERETHELEVRANREKELRIKAEQAAAEAKAKAEAEAAEQKVRAEKEAAEEKAREERLRKEEEAGRLAREMFAQIVANFDEPPFAFIKDMPASQKPLAAVSGAWNYLLPFSDKDEKSVLLLSKSNGVMRAERLYQDGAKDDIPNYEPILASLENRDYLVACSNGVYFHSTSRKPHVGPLRKDAVEDLALAFFRDLGPEIKKFNLDFDAISFEIVFVPQNERTGKPDGKKAVVTQIVPYGGTYSFDRIREAVEDANPPIETTNFRGTPKKRRFKRTVVYWEGAHIKRGIDGITYVPRVAPSQAYRKYGDGYYGWIDGYRVWYHNNRQRARAEQTRDYWETLCKEADKQEAEEARINKQNERTNTTESSLKYRQRIDDILSKGSLFWRVRISSDALKGGSNGL